jgi:eukaryotic-like serine/threonine-protein kinase
MAQPSGASLAPGTRIGVYEIAGAIGAGGMGQVYRARDTRLDRDVALKILPDAFAADADRVMRFTREAKTLAALNHPHIAHIYDAGREGARAFIAMELVEGEDLSARIRRGAIPIPETLQLARQIADALAVAHDAGIVHRDLKPGNIKVTDDGDVKVLDFGLAKGAAGDGSSAGDSGATMTSPAMTAIGLIIGTASYMSPEQAKGKTVDRRADVWAFGVVLYEMLTGALLFRREDVTDTLAAVLTYEPDLSKLPPATPPPVRRLIERCLVKDKKLRLDSMNVARIELDDVISGKTPLVVASSQPPRGLKPTVAAVAALAAGLVGVLATSFYYSRNAAPAAAAPRLVAQIAAPREVISAFHDGFALSSDGSTLAFAARNAAGLRQIWIRRLDSDAARAIPGTDSGRYPFWAPDSRSIGFIADAKLKRVDVDGGRLQTISDVPGSGESGSWNAKDEILFAASLGETTRIRKVSANGGTPVPFDALRVAFGPVWLKNGQRFLFVELTKEGKAELRLASVDGQSSDFIAALPRGTREFAYGGGILFLNRNDALVAQRLDDETGKLVGPAATIAPVAGNPKDWFAVSSDGERVVTFVRQAPDESGQPGDPVARLIWTDRQGNTTGSLGDPGRYWTLRLSPDGNSAVVNPGWDLWWLRPDGRHTRLTTSAPVMASVGAVWKHDASELIYTQSGEIVRRRVDAQSSVIKLGHRGTPQDWSKDGRWLLFTGRANPASTTVDIMLYDFESKTVRPWLATDFSDNAPRFSPDGTWVAYSSNVSGRQEVYLRPFEGEGQPIAVSSNGGAYPFWRRDGNELFFLDPGDDVMAVSLTRSGPTIVPGKPERLFRIPLNDITRGSWAPYGVSPDGQRFLLNVPDRPTPLFYLQGLRGLMK